MTVGSTSEQFERGTMGFSGGSNPFLASSTGEDGSSSGRKAYPNYGLPANDDYVLEAMKTGTALGFFGSVRRLLTITAILYALNQSHCLPKPVGGVVSKVLFWPTLPIAWARRIGKWTTKIDDTIVMGGAPFGFAKLPEKLYDEYGVRAVVNMCDEYAGPIAKYEKLGINQIRLKTVDHFVPSFEDLRKAVEFIQQNEKKGKRVYVHCRAGHGRSGATVFAWLLSKYPSINAQYLNRELRKIRNVKSTLWKQPEIVKFHKWIKKEKNRPWYPDFRKVFGIEDPDFAEEEIEVDEDVSTGYSDIDEPDDSVAATVGREMTKSKFADVDDSSDEDFEQMSTWNIKDDEEF